MSTYLIPTEKRRASALMKLTRKRKARGRRLLSEVLIIFRVTTGLPGTLSHRDRIRRLVRKEA